MFSAPLECDEESATNAISGAPYEEGNLAGCRDGSEGIRGGLRDCEEEVAGWKKGAAIDAQDKGNWPSSGNGVKCQWEDFPVSPFESCRETTSIYSAAEVGEPTGSSCVSTSEQHATSNAKAVGL